jgi:hypothetical protein
MILPPLAHSAHWLVDLAYILPFVGLLVWLFVTTIRERRRSEREAAGEQPDA